MHLLQTGSVGLDDLVEPVDLGQTPGDIVVLSFADSDLSGLAAAYAAEKDRLPSLRLAHLRDLRHPMSVDLWIDQVARHAKLIVVRLLGGLDWWRYGWLCCRERIAPIRVSIRSRPCRPTSLPFYSPSSAKADATICGHCSAASPLTWVPISTQHSRKPCRGKPAIFLARAR
jgi:cobaltochelatase CobN